MLETFGASGWQFARLEMALSECPKALSTLLKNYRASAKRPGEEVFACKCVKSDQNSTVRFHKINADRAAHCMVQVIQEFPAGETPELTACCQTVHTCGFNREVVWEKGGIRGEWRTTEGERQSGRVAWKQLILDKDVIDADVWVSLWRQAARSLGIEPMLRDVQAHGLTAVEIISDEHTRFCYDARGFRVYAQSELSGELSIGIAEVDAASVEAIRTLGLATITNALGAPAGQLLTFIYYGDNESTTGRLNEVLPICHAVSYLLNDNARDKFYPNMFKPLALSPKTILALPAIELEREVANRIHTILVTNVVRTSTDTWLEFQTTLSPDIFTWIEETLGCQLERWHGPAETRWGWYNS